MRKLLDKKWLFPAAVALLLCVTALGVQLTVSAYIRRSYVKAVVATNEMEKLFGSNLLYGVKNQPEDPDADSWLSAYPFTVSDPNQQSITVPIRIYNYLAEDRDRVNQLDVSYVISFRVSGMPSMEGGALAGYSVNGMEIGQKDVVYYLGAGGLVTDPEQAAPQTLPGRLPNLNQYDVRIPGADLGKVSIAVKAKRMPNAGEGSYGTDLLYLAARVVPSLASTVQTATVSGGFTYHEGLPEDYAAYNYSIELAGAPTAVMLTWDAELLEIDPFFAKKYGVEPGVGQVIFNMEPGITRIQFYRSGNVDGIGWDALGVTVTER